MVEKILFEYIIDSRQSGIFKGWERITITSKNIYVYEKKRPNILRWTFGYIFKNTGIKNQEWLLKDLSEIYNENLEIINKYEELKNKFLEYLNYSR